MDINDTDSDHSGALRGGKKKKSSMRKDAEKYAKALSRRGVVYLSKVPPFMKPNKIKSLLEHYGEISRLYLAEEDAATRKKRQLNGGNGSKQFKEGWIEFADKKIARSVAESLNNTSVGYRKGDYYHDDLWNLKYLSGFKWDFLTEKFAYERRIREQKLNSSMNQAKKQNADMIQLIEKQHVQKLIQDRRSGRASGTADDDEASEEMSEPAASSSSKKRKSSSDRESSAVAADPRFVLPASVGGSRSDAKKKRSDERVPNRGRTFHQAKVLGINHGETQADDE
jgi:ESF2/ABP1 family protein